MMMMMQYEWAVEEDLKISDARSATFPFFHLK